METHRTHTMNDFPQPPLLNVAVIGLGKMGLSHLSIIKPHPDVMLTAVCDASKLVLEVLHKYTGVEVYSDATRMLAEVETDAVVIATPTASHLDLVSAAVDAGKHVFCEKPLTLCPEDSMALVRAARTRQVHHQVGYHYRFVAAFQECKRLLDAGAVGRVVHAQAEAYGPVILKTSGSTWRSRRDQGGGCLYDYAAHPIDLLNWYLGEPQSVSGTVMGTILSAETEDEVYATIRYPDGVSSQLSVNWSDESQRKMSTRVRIWGTHGTIDVDRQECQVYLRGPDVPDGYHPGWNVRYTTDLSNPVNHYVRGEEYSAQLDYFVARCLERSSGATAGGSVAADFTSAAQTDEVIGMLLRDRDSGTTTTRPDLAVTAAPPSRTGRNARPGRLHRVGATARKILAR
jgi:scyllo-inositol 2-dehydrogenase (NADP+)